MSIICRYTAVTPQNLCQEQNLLFVNSYGDKPMSASVTQEHLSLSKTPHHPFSCYRTDCLNSHMLISNAK